MKRFCYAALMVLILSSGVEARDFIVKFVGENYREATENYAKTPIIYHSIQVATHAGPKVLILTGDDRHYRIWLRQYIASTPNFVVKVPDTDTHSFISSKAYEVDVTRIHPFLSQVQGHLDEKEMSGGRIVAEDGHILIVDTDLKKGRLMSQVIRKMGFRPMVITDPKRALATFRIQPDRFAMIITSHGGEKPYDFIEQVVTIDHLVPILFETGYRKKQILKESIGRFTGNDSVRIIPMALKNLQNNIKELVMDNV
ncbi:MAG: hypothetical protein MI749_05170 [Desulfovibrionales bacterium]|nr:hypothetical protein [Desulfovibrionales bacterium]